jgi:hypothetical protein
MCDEVGESGQFADTRVKKTSTIPLNVGTTHFKSEPNRAF